MKSADEYAERADFALSVAREQSGQDRTDAILMAQVYATQQGAAATIEAVRLMGPTPEDQARLDALMSKTAPFKLDYVPCLHKWQGCPVGEFEDHVCDLVKDHTQARHHCVCGAISR